MVDSSIPNWLLYGGGLALLVGAYIDIRRQTIAGSLPTEFTKTVMQRLETVEDDLKEERQANIEYKAKARQWHGEVVSALRANGIDVPIPPDGFPG